MQELIINYGSIVILILRVMIVGGLLLFLKEYLKHRPLNQGIRIVHHIVIAFVISLGVMLTQSIIFRAFIFSPYSLDEMEVFIISFTNTAITFVLMVYAYREYKYLLKIAEDEGAIETIN